LNRNLVRQKDILSNEVELAQKKFDNETVLFEKGHISESKLSDAKSVYFQKKHTLESAEGNIIRNNIQLAEYQKTIMDLNQQYRERKRELVFSIQETYKKLLSQLAIWEQKYILKAPIDGHVSFFKFWSDNQFINSGDEVMAIVPNSRDIIGKIYVPAMGSGKIKTGQEVRIKFDSYPFNEFGAVEGKIMSISLISRDNVYLINVNLPNGLTTNYNKDLEFKQEMQGTADIITENLRLSERVFNQLRYILSSTVSQ